MASISKPVSGNIATQNPVALHKRNRRPRPLIGSLKYFNKRAQERENRFLSAGAGTITAGSAKGDKKKDEMSSRVTKAAAANGIPKSPSLTSSDFVIPQPNLPMEPVDTKANQAKDKKPAAGSDVHAELDNIIVSLAKV